MNITITGGGNIGTQFAVHCAAEGHRVAIYSSKPSLFSKRLSIVDAESKVICTGEIAFVTDDPEKAFGNAELIFVTLPSFCMEEISDKILPYAKHGLMIGLIPGTGGGECAFRQCSDRGAIIFGLQRVPSVARLIKYGRTVRATGYRDKLHVSALQKDHTDRCSHIISELFDIPCVSMPDYLNLTLVPSNPILHTVRLYSLFKDYHSGVIYDKVPLFYEDWDISSSTDLFKCDDEVQNICKVLKMFDIRYVSSLKKHYESETPEQLTNKIRSISGFKGILTPMIKTYGGYIPDLDSRYFTADFPFGLSILIQIADLFDTDATNMKKIMKWYLSLPNKATKCFSYSRYGINSKEDFISFYSGQKSV